MSGSGSRAALATLVSLEGMGPARLRAVLAGRTPSEALEAVLALRPPEPSPPDRPAPRISDDLLRRWQRQARTADPSDLLAAYGRGGFEVVMYGERGYPQQLLVDPDPPLVLSIDGDLQRIATRAVAIVGTRRCTRAGYDTAYRLGRDLSVAGVSVVSGLAAGIDAAAHRGAVDAHGASPLRGGRDRARRALPPEQRSALAGRRRGRNARLGGSARRPTRPLALPVAQSHHRRTRRPRRRRRVSRTRRVDAHRRRGRCPIGRRAHRAGPGPGANQRRHQRPAFRGPRCGARCRRRPPRLGIGTPCGHARRLPAASRPEPDARVLDAFEWQPATVDLLAVRTGLDPFEVCSVLDGLVASRVVVERAGWYERSDEVVRGLER